MGPPQSQPSHMVSRSPSAPPRQFPFRAASPAPRSATPGPACMGNVNASSARTGAVSPPPQSAAPGPIALRGSVNVSSARHGAASPAPRSVAPGPALTRGSVNVSSARNGAVLETSFHSDASFVSRHDLARTGSEHCFRGVAQAASCNTASVDAVAAACCWCGKAKSSCDCAAGMSGSALWSRARPCVASPPPPTSVPKVFPPRSTLPAAAAAAAVTEAGATGHSRQMVSRAQSPSRIAPTAAPCGRGPCGAPPPGPCGAPGMTAAWQHPGPGSASSPQDLLLSRWQAWNAAHGPP